MNEHSEEHAEQPIPYGRTWSFIADEAYVGRMLRAYNRAYRRKTGKGYFVFCLLLDALVIVGTVKALSEGVDVVGQLGIGGMLGAYVLFPALTVFFAVQALVPDRMPFWGRKRVAKELAEELAGNGDGTVRARFDALGITLSAGTELTRVPYAACYDTATIDEETFVLVGSEEEQSVLHNLAGDNAMLRDNVGFAFAAPADSADAIVAAGKRQLKHAQEDEAYRNRLLSYMDG